MQKKRRALCRACRFYGINVFALSGAEKLALLGNLEALRAEEILRDPSVRLNNKEIYELTLLATGDPRQAEDARIRAIELELFHGETPVI